MSTYPEPPAPVPVRKGWLAYAATMLVIAGAFNIVHGITALGNGDYFTSSKLVFANMTVWGWIFLGWGVLQAAAGFGVVRRRASAPMLGVAVAGIGAIIWFFFLFAAPWAALLGAFLNLSVVYGLTAGYGEAWPDR